MPTRNRHEIEHATDRRQNLYDTQSNFGAEIWTVCHQLYGSDVTSQRACGVNAPIFYYLKLKDVLYVLYATTRSNNKKVTVLFVRA